MAYEFVGESADDRSGWSVSSAGDVDGDGKADLLIGATHADGGTTGANGNNEGSTYLINAADLATLDAADGTSDGVIDLGNVAATGSSYEFVGESSNDWSGYSVSSAGDVDGDGKDDLLIGARFADDGTPGYNEGGTYLINADDLATLDAADGTSDGVIHLGNVAATGTSYEFVGESSYDQSGISVSSAGDVDGDGNDDLLIGAYQAGDGTGGFNEGGTYLINADDLATLDAADGTSDGVIDLGNVAATGSSYEFVGESEQDQSGISVSSAGDVDGDGKDDLLIGAYQADDGTPGNSEGSTYLINAADLAALDAADGTSDGVIDLGNVAATGTSYEFVGESVLDQSGFSVSSAGDVNNDGMDDLLIGAHYADDGTPGNSEGSTYLINAADLAALDAADGTSDGVIDLGNVGTTGSSYEFVGESSYDQSGISVSSAGDVDGDGNDDLLIGAWGGDDGTGGSFEGSTYLINADDLATLDAADGTSDGVIDLGNVAATGTSYEFVGESGQDNSGWSVSSAGDVDGDGEDDLLIGAYGADDVTPGTNEGSTYLIEADQLAYYDGLDGTVDGVIDLGNVNVQCFHAGTLIASPSGEAKVETLQIGDKILTADGRAIPVKWLAHQTIVTRFYGPRAEPVRITKGALGNGLPHSDLTVTGDHGMALNGYMINASALVNGDTIHWVPMAALPERFTVYHVETEAHDIILANGAPTETYLDIADRQGFDNYAEYQAIYGAEPLIQELPLPRIASQRMLGLTKPPQRRA